MKIALVSVQRLDSSRIPRKMLQEVNGRTLAERSFDVVRQTADRYGLGAFAAVGEPELIEIAAESGLDILMRSDRSLSTATCLEEYWDGWWEPLREKGYDCMIRPMADLPFLTPDNFAPAIEYVQAGNLTFSTVFRRSGPIWDHDMKPMFGDCVTPTSHRPPHEKACVPEIYHVAAHVFYGHDIAGLGPIETTFDPTNLLLLSNRDAYRFGVDFPEDLELCRRVAPVFDGDREMTVHESPKEIQPD